MPKSVRAPIGAAVTLAAANDLDGDATLTLSLSGKMGALIIQRNDGAAGTTGIDVVEISRDGGKQWAAATTVLDSAGAAVTNGILNAAGVEPTAAAVFSIRTGAGPCMIRISRLAATQALSAAWTTGAPSVIAIPLGG